VKRYPLASPLGIGLKVARELAGFTPAELAKRAGVGVNDVHRAERGWVVPEDDLRSIAQALQNTTAVVGDGTDR